MVKPNRTDPGAWSVAVAGAGGYVGGELRSPLIAHEDVEIGALTTGARAGKAVGPLQPHLAPLVDRVLLETNAARGTGGLLVGACARRR